MKQNEILVIYGKNYTTLARQLLEEAHLAGDDWRQGESHRDQA